MRPLASVAVIQQRELIKRAFATATCLHGSSAMRETPAEFLLSRRIERVPKEQVMLELLETIDIDAQIVRRCRALKQKGFELALDDAWQYSEKFEPLLEQALRQWDNEVAIEKEERLESMMAHVERQCARATRRARESAAEAPVVGPGFTISR